MSFIIDTKSVDSCINSIKQFMHDNKHTTLINNLIMIESYNLYYNDVNEHFPSVLTDVIIRYCDSIFDIKCNLTHKFNNHYILYVTNEELNINFQINIVYGSYITIYYLNINRIRSSGTWLVNHDSCANYYIKHHVLNIHINDQQNDFEDPMYEKIIKYIDHRTFTAELMVIGLLFSRLDDIKIEK